MAWIIPAISALTGIFGASSANNTANNANATANAAMQNQQNWVNQYQAPLAQSAVNLNSQMTPITNSQTSWLNQMASGNNASLPSWLQTPDWKNPFTQDELNSLSAIQDLTAQQQGTTAYNQAQGSLAKRGLSAPGITSTADVASNSGLSNWITARKAENQAYITQLGMQRGDQLRNESLNKYSTLNNMVNQRFGQLQQSTALPSSYQSQANYSANQAAQSQNQANQLWGNVGTSLAGLFNNTGSNNSGAIGNDTSAQGGYGGTLLGTSLGNPYSPYNNANASLKWGL